MAQSFTILQERPITEVNSQGELTDKIFVVVKINGGNLAVVEFLANQYDRNERRRLIAEKLNQS